jgi:antitoxin component YwqK of YwqJK toxin-antitoxin module
MKKLSILLFSILISLNSYGEWTDFSPQPTEEEITTIDREKYRKLFEDKELIMLVLGGIEYWNMTCGTLSKTGNYFMNLAIKKHGIDKDKMDMDMGFQTGLFVAVLYNDCDIFLEQVDSIGLKMMYTKTDIPGHYGLSELLLPLIEQTTDKDGIFKTTYTYWDENGQKTHADTYKDGYLKKSTYWDKNGQKTHAYTYQDGYEKNPRFGLVYLHDGISKFNYWYENGQKELEVQDGKSTRWDENGQIKSESIYKDGVCISEDCPN